MMSRVVMPEDGPPNRPAPFPQATGDDLDKDPARLRVIVVEDELFVALHLESVLESFGHEVLALASSGADALAEIASARPDAVLLDVNLGAGLSGVEVAERLRGETLRIVFITAYVDQANRQRMTEAAPGCVILSKPISEDALRAALEAPTRTS